MAASKMLKRTARKPSMNQSSVSIAAEGRGEREGRKCFVLVDSECNVDHGELSGIW